MQQQLYNNSLSNNNSFISNIQVNNRVNERTRELDELLLLAADLDITDMTP